MMAMVFYTNELTYTSLTEVISCRGMLALAGRLSLFYAKLGAAICLLPNGMARRVNYLMR